MSEYEAQAQKFLDTYGFEIKTAFKGDRCPPWEEKCIHGDRYRVTIRRKVKILLRPASLSFDFWNSQRDMQEGKRPSPYAVLSCISSEASSPTDADEVVEEYGPMPPSKAKAIAASAKRFQSFFTEDELSALSEIQ